MKSNLAREARLATTRAASCHLLNQFLRPRANVALDVGEPQWLECASGDFGSFLFQLGLGQRNDVTLVFRLKLNSALQVLNRAGEVFTLDKLEYAQKVMSGSEIGHQGECFVKLRTDFAGPGGFQPHVPAGAARAGLKFFARILVMSQETCGAALERLAKPA